MPRQLDALNYPYIRVRSLDWLKRTLLIFPHVVRISPSIRAPAEDPEISAFTDIIVDRHPLLRPAKLNSPHVLECQAELVANLQARLEADGPRFRLRYGHQAASRPSASLIKKNLTVWERRLSAHATFQIHTHKLFDHLVYFLLQEGLAWTPDSSEAEGPDYIEMHPHLGEAVMATLAMACAENEGLQVVTEFPELHGKLLGTPRKEILSACLDGIRPTGETSAQQIAEFFVYRRCNTEMLSAENIVALKDERAALADFRKKLEELSQSLPLAIYSEETLQERLEDTLSDMLKEWKKQQADMGHASRLFFGDGLSSEFKKIAEKLTEAALKPETGVDTVKAALLGGVTGQVLTSVGAGFVIAVAFRTIESWGKTRREAKASPLRYLTKLEEQGVSFSISP